MEDLFQLIFRIINQGLERYKQEIHDQVRTRATTSESDDRHYDAIVAVALHCVNKPLEYFISPRGPASFLFGFILFLRDELDDFATSHEDPRINLAYQVLHMGPGSSSQFVELEKVILDINATDVIKSDDDSLLDEMLRDIDILNTYDNLTVQQEYALVALLVSEFSTYFSEKYDERIEKDDMFSLLAALSPYMVLAEQFSVEVQRFLRTHNS